MCKVLTGSPLVPWRRRPSDLGGFQGDLDEGTVVADFLPMIGIIGASGRLGQQLLTHFLSQGERVHALCRRTHAIRRAADNLTVFRGDVETGEGLGPFLSWCSTVVWAARCRRPALGMRNLVGAMGGRRGGTIIMVSHLGVGETAAQARHAKGVLQRCALALRAPWFARLEDAEAVLRAHTGHHVILRPTELTDSSTGGRVVTMGPAGHPPGPVSRSDLARFIVRVARDPSWRDSAVTVGAVAA